MCPPGYHHNGFVATNALGHMMYGYTLLAPMNQDRHNNIQSAQIWQKQDEHNIYTIMKTVCPRGYHMMYGYTLLVPINQDGHNDTQSAQIWEKHDEHNIYAIMKRRVHCFHDCISIMLILLLWDLSTPCHGSLITTYIMLLSYQCVTVHHVPKYMSCHKATVVIILFSWLRIYYAHLAFVKFEHSVCCGSLMSTYIMLLA